MKRGLLPEGLSAGVANRSRKGAAQLKRGFAGLSWRSLRY